MVGQFFYRGLLFLLEDGIRSMKFWNKKFCGIQVADWGKRYSVRLGRLLRMLCGQYKILRGSSSRRELNLGLG